MNFESTFAEREKLVFFLLEKLGKKFDFVVIGGYAVNAFTLPRFSIDCDIVALDEKTGKKIVELLEQNGFVEKSRGSINAADGKFVSLACNKPTPATFDILIGAIEDRQSGTIFPAEFVFKNSAKRQIFGKSMPFSIKTNIVNAEMLFVMKAICARKTDIRDVLMLASTKLDKKYLKKIAKFFPISKNSVQKIVSTIASKNFKDSLQGVFGKLQEKQFDFAKKKLFSLIELLEKK